LALAPTAASSGGPGESQEPLRVAVSKTSPLKPNLPCPSLFCRSLSLLLTESVRFSQTSSCSCEGMSSASSMCPTMLAMMSTLSGTWRSGGRRTGEPQTLHAAGCCQSALRPAPGARYAPDRPPGEELLGTTRGSALRRRVVKWSCLHFTITPGDCVVNHGSFGSTSASTSASTSDCR
jgi:hypothetical protein